MSVSGLWNQVYESVKAVTQPVKVEAVDVPQASSKMSEVTSLLLRLALSAGLSLVLGKILLDMMDPTRKEKKSAEKRVNSNDDTYMYFVYIYCVMPAGVIRYHLVTVILYVCVVEVIF